MNKINQTESEKIPDKYTNLKEELGLTDEDVRKLGRPINSTRRQIAKIFVFSRSGKLAYLAEVRENLDKKHAQKVLSFSEERLEDFLRQTCNSNFNILNELVQGYEEGGPVVFEALINLKGVYGEDIESLKNFRKSLLEAQGKFGNEVCKKLGQCKDYEEFASELKKYMDEEAEEKKKITIQRRAEWLTQKERVMADSVNKQEGKEKEKEKKQREEKWKKRQEEEDRQKRLAEEQKKREEEEKEEIEKQKFREKEKPNYKIYITAVEDLKEDIENQFERIKETHKEGMPHFWKDSRLLYLLKCLKEQMEYKDMNDLIGNDDLEGGRMGTRELICKRHWTYLIQDLYIAKNFLEAYYPEQKNLIDVLKKQIKKFDGLFDYFDLKVKPIPKLLGPYEKNHGNFGDKVALEILIRAADDKENKKRLVDTISENRKKLGYDEQIIILHNSLPIYDRRDGKKYGMTDLVYFNAAVQRGSLTDEPRY